MLNVLFLIFAFLVIAKSTLAESIFVAPDVFITSKIKPTQDFESDRGNILFESHDLEKNRQYSIGEILKDLPGISSSSLGNSSRPIIRGMSNSRVKILQNSSTLSDASELGEDHIVGYDAMLIDKIEIIKGPATLLYGNNAFAGAVNIINPLIAIDKPLKDKNIEVGSGYKTSGGELKTALKFGKSFNNFTVRGMGSILSAGPYKLANTSSKQANSSKFNSAGGVGLTYNDGQNFFGFSFDKLESVYDIPGSEGEENLTSLNPTRNTINFKSSLTLDNNLFKKLNLEATVSEYSHAERTGSGNHNIEFSNDSYELKTTLNHKSLINHNNEGLIGFHYQNSNQKAEGDEESHLTSTKTNSFALFILEKFKFDLFEIDVGGRLESVNLKNTNFEKGFFPVSFSSNLKRDLFDNSSTFIGFDFSQRAPNAVELFANGPHHALENYEIGDSNINKESSYNFSLGYVYDENLNRLKIETYANYIDDFIAADRDGNTVDVEGEDFNNVLHNQYNAFFTGLELSGQYSLVKFNDFNLLSNFMVDFLKGYKTSTDKALSRVPQTKINFGLQLVGEDWDSGIKYNHYFDKEFICPFQTRTGGHSRLDFDLTKDFSYSYLNGHLTFTINNLLNVVGRNHLESKKESVQLPGRSFNILAKFLF
jgi:iron complex outermembrane receptor protein